MKKILIGRGDALGDLVLSTILIEPLRRHFPNCEIYFIANPAFASLLDNHPNVAGVIKDPLPHRFSIAQLPKIWRWSRHIRKQRFDLFLGAWGSPKYAFLSRMAGIPIRVGHPWGIWNRLFYTLHSKIDPRDFTVHQAMRNLALSAALRLPISESPINLGALPPKKTDDPLVCIQLDAGHPRRVWPADRLIRIIHFILSRTDLSVVLFGKNSNAIADEVIQHFSGNSRVRNLFGKLTPVDMKNLLSQSSLFIGADSGPLHLAAGLGVPTIGYYPTKIQNPMEWGPWKTPHVVFLSRFACRTVCHAGRCFKKGCDIPIPDSEIFDAVDGLLSGRIGVPSHPKKYWAQQTLTLGVVEPKREWITKLSAEWYCISLEPNLSISDIKNKMIQNNINMLVFHKEKPGIKFRLARMWASNYLFFFPQIKTRAEWESL